MSFGEIIARLTKGHESSKTHCFVHDWLYPYGHSGSKSIIHAEACTHGLLASNSSRPTLIHAPRLWPRSRLFRSRSTYSVPCMHCWHVRACQSTRERALTPPAAIPEMVLLLSRRADRGSGRPGPHTGRACPASACSIV